MRATITLELGFWIADPKNGTLWLSSDINLGILHGFRSAGIEVPFPQREIAIRGSTPEGAPPEPFDAGGRAVPVGAVAPPAG